MEPDEIAVTGSIERKDIDSYFQNKKLLYFSDAGPRLSVFASQSIGMYKAWSKLIDSDLIYRNPLDAEQYSEGKAIEQVGSMARILLKKEIRVNQLRDIIPRYDFIHCRGPLATYMAIKSLGKSERKLTKVIFDCRGLISEELGISLGRVMFQPIKMVRYLEQAKMDKFAVDKSDVFLTVSEEMSHHYKGKFGRTADLAVPTIVDEQSFLFSSDKRDDMRRKLGVENGRLFLYVGGIDKWQRLDILGKFWEKHSNHNQNDRLVILTRDKKSFLDVLSIPDKSIADKIIFDYVPYEKVPSYMFAADIGIMFRDDSIVNRAASPVKLSEYLASGLPVITNCEYMVNRDPRLIYKLNDDFDMTDGINISDNDQRRKSSISNSQSLSGRAAVERIKRILVNKEIDCKK